MNAAEYLAGLDDAPRLARPHRLQRVAARPVDAGEAEQVDRRAEAPPEGEPGVLGRDAPPAARPAGRPRRILVDPSAGMIAVDAGGREIACPGEPLQPADRVAVQVDDGVARRVRRDRDQEMRRAGQHLGGPFERPVPIEGQRLDAACGERLPLVPAPAGAGYAPAAGPQRVGECQGGISEAETEQARRGVGHDAIRCVRA